MMSPTTNTVSKTTFECYVCKKDGFPNERVYLAGKDAHGKTIYIADDGVTAHVHKFKPSTKSANTNDAILSKLDTIDAKLDRLLATEGQEVR